MAGETLATKEVYEGTICKVDSDGVKEPSFFVYVRANDSGKSRKLIDAALEEIKDDLVEAEARTYKSDVLFIASVNKKLVRCYFLKEVESDVEVYLLDEGLRTNVKRKGLFACPESVKNFELFCCIRPVLIDDVLAPQIEVAKALNGFKCRFIGVSAEVHISDGKPYASGMVLVEYETGSFSDIKDIGTKPIEGRECPQFRVEALYSVKEDNLVAECATESKTDLLQEAGDSGEQSFPLQEKDLHKCYEVTQQQCSGKRSSLVNDNADSAFLPKSTDRPPSFEEVFEETGNSQKCSMFKKTRPFSKKLTVLCRKPDTPSTVRSSSSACGEEKYDYNRNSIRDSETRFQSEFAVETDYGQSPKVPFSNNYNFGRRFNDNSRCFYRGNWNNYPERNARFMGNNRRRGDYYRASGYYDNDETFEELFLRQKTFREFEPSNYPCKMRMRFGRKESGLRVTTFWIIDTVTFTNVERVLHEGRVRYKQTPGFGLSRIHELVGTGCLASVFMDEIYILARAVITKICEESCSFSIYLVDYGFYKTTKLKDLIDVSHINKADPILTLPLSMLRCQLESSSPLKLMELERGYEYEFEILRRKANGVYVVTADRLRNEDPILSASSLNKDSGVQSEGSASTSHQSVPEYESIVKMLESRIDMLGNNMIGNTLNNGWLHSNSIYNSPASNVIRGIGYNSFAYPFPCWQVSGLVRPNNFGYAMPVFMPMAVPMTQENVNGDGKRVVKDEPVNQISESQRNTHNSQDGEEKIVEIENSYDNMRRRPGMGFYGFSRGLSFRGEARRDLGTDEYKPFQKSHSGDFSRGRRSQGYRRDFGKNRGFVRQDGDKAYSFESKDSLGERKPSFGFSLKNRGSPLASRNRNTAPAFLGNASSEWDLPAHCEQEEVSCEEKKRGETVEFF